MRDLLCWGSNLNLLTPTTCIQRVRSASVYVQPQRRFNQPPRGDNKRLIPLKTAWRRTIILKKVQTILCLYAGLDQAQEHPSSNDDTVQEQGEQSHKQTVKPSSASFRDFSIKKGANSTSGWRLRRRPLLRSLPPPLVSPLASS